MGNNFSFHVSMEREFGALEGLTSTVGLLQREKLTNQRGVYGFDRSKQTELGLNVLLLRFRVRAAVVRETRCTALSRLYCLLHARDEDEGGIAIATAASKISVLPP